MKMGACAQWESGGAWLRGLVAGCDSSVHGHCCRPCAGRRSDRGHEEPRSVKSFVSWPIRTSNSQVRRTSAASCWKRPSGSGLITKKCPAGRLGAPWANLPEKDKQEFVSLFQTLLVNTYADKIESYSGEGVQYVNERNEKEYAEVRTKVLTGKTEIPLDYRLLHKGSDWRVYDVVVDGVSLVNNYRGQFSKILRNGSYADLVEQLRKKSEKIKSP